MTARQLGRVLVIGAQGVIGSAVARHLSDAAQWRVATAARRPAPAQSEDHVQVDLLDESAAKEAFTALRDVTHVVYAAYTERATMAATTGPNVQMLRTTLRALETVGAPLQRVVLIGGGKSYGEHLGPYKTPAKESDPRMLGPVFYNDQEDLLWAEADRQGYDWTVLRPDAVIGSALGSPMNMLHGIAVYATICRSLDIPLRFPGSPGAWTALHQSTDAGLLAEAVEWALTAGTASREVFNVTNGDNFRWQHLWPDIANFFDIPTQAPQPMLLAEQMADKEPVWDAIVAGHGLQPVTYEQMVSWPFVDAVLRTDYDMVQSTIKIRRAGFTGCIDTHDSMLRNLQDLRTRRLIPSS